MTSYLGTVAPESFPEPGTPVLVLGGSIHSPDVQGLCDQLRLLFESNQGYVVECDVGALTDPDCGALNALARLALTARRGRRRIRLRNTSTELQDLLAFAGLTQVVPCLAASAVQPQWQAKQREEPGGVQEEGDPADLTA